MSSPKDTIPLDILFPSDSKMSMWIIDSHGESKQIPSSRWNGKLVNYVKQSGEEKLLGAAMKAIEPATSSRVEKKEKLHLRLIGTLNQRKTEKSINKLVVTMRQIITDYRARSTTSNISSDIERLKHHPLLADAVEAYVKKDKHSATSIFSLLQDLSDQDEEALMKMGDFLLKEDPSQINEFLLCCKNSETFRKIVNQLSAARVKNFIHFATKNNRAIPAAVEVMKLRKEAIPVFFYFGCSEVMSNADIIEIGRTIGEEDLFSRFVDAKKQMNPPHLLNLFHRLPIIETTNKVETILRYRLPITDEMLHACLTTLHYPGIHLLLSQLDPDFINSSKEVIYDVLMSLRDPVLGDIINTYHPHLGKKVSDETIFHSIQDGNDWFVCWALEHGKKIKPLNAAQWVPYAVEAGNIPLIRRLCEIASKNKYGETFLFPEVLGLDQIEDPKEQLNLLVRFALFSPMEEIYRLVELYPNFSCALKKILELIPLMVRFPSINFAAPVGNFQASVNKYVEESVSYAKKNLKLIKQLLPQLNTLSRRNLLKAIMEDRFDRLDKDNPQRLKYNSRRTKNQMPQETKLHLAKKLDFGLTTDGIELTVDLSPQRYAWCLKHLYHAYYDPNENKWTPPSSDTIQYHQRNKSVMYSYVFHDSDGRQKRVNTTQLNAQIMLHTPVETIEELQEHMELLHREILDFPLEKDNPESINLFFEKVARGYWLIATLCETMRGTPHNAMIWLNLIYAHHRLPPPIPTIDHFFLDNTMIVTPIEKAIQEWTTYFEPNFQRDE